MARANYDYVVIGGGSAGCIVAARLAQESQASVLLLEAGDEAENNPDTLTADGFKYSFANDNVMWDRMSVKQKHCGNRYIYNGTGMGMGGSGSVNGMVYTPGDKHDFDQWPKGWQWDDVAPVFKSLEQRLDVRSREGTEFTAKVLEAAKTIGLDTKHGLTDGEIGGFMGHNAMNFAGDTRRSSYVAFLKDQHSSNLHIITQAKVSNVEIQAQRAVAVHYTIAGQAHHVAVNKEVIMAAGALETPKLLMLSGIGGRQHLESLGIHCKLDVPSIGQNLQDHPNVCMFAKGEFPIDFGYPQVYGFKRMNPATNLAENQPDTCIAMLAAPLTVQQSMYRMVPATLLPPRLFDKRGLRKLFKPLINFAFMLPPIKRLVARTYGYVVILGKPFSVGSVRLASNDPDMPALVDPNYYADERDIQTLLKGVKAIQAMAQSAPLQSWGSRFLNPKLNRQDDKSLIAWIKQGTITTFHFCGTCAMGDSESQPVSADLKLKGIENIRIADASAIPVIPVSALNAPTMMLAYRAADFILQQEKHA